MNLSKKIAILYFLLICLSTYAKDIYVAKNGSDDNPGTLESPYLTITKAASVAVAGDIVNIREGTYEETLTPLNSGEPGNPIIYQSYNNEKVIISAMQTLTGWTQDSGSIYKTTIDFTSLKQENFVMHNETALDLARWPNKTEQDPFALGTLRNTGGSDASVISGAFLTESSIPGIDWTGGALWFYGDRPGSGWLAWKRTITSSSAGRVNFNFTANQDWIRNAHPPSDKGDFFLEGVKGALDYKNEWYFDENSKTLFIQLPGGAIPADGDVKMRRRIETININNKKYIEIRNLAVFGGIIKLDDDTRWTTNSNTTNNVLYGISSFYGAHTQGVTDNFGTQIASVKIEGSNNTVENCEIAFGAAGGINVKGQNHLITENYIHDFDYLGYYDAPVVVRGISNTILKNNTVKRGGRDCIQYFGTDNELAYNDVSQSNMIADDCGLFYTVGVQPNTEIHHNWFHDAYSSGSKKKAAGIYLDNDAAGFSVHHNVVWNTEWSNIQINWNGTDIDIFNNTLWKGEKVMGAWHKEGTAFSNVKVWNNLGSDDNWEPQSDKQNNLVVDSSVFVSSETGDFYLKNGSSPIDAGREIQGITDGFVGSNPDVGAYENGAEKWVAGISWDPEFGPVGQGCYGLPGEDCSIPIEDQDKDGVADEFDKCPDTPAGSLVNTEGCVVFSLAADNFKVLTTGESCASSNDGTVTITSTETSLNFTASVEGNTIQQDFTSNTTLSNLSAGNYIICITTSANIDYKQCFDVVIVEPEPLSVFSKVDKDKQQVTLDLHGAQRYRINLNDVITVTDQSSITLKLNSGENNLVVSTDKDCQGKHKQNILVFDQVTIFPTLVDRGFTIAFPEIQNKPIDYQIISTTGRIVAQETIENFGNQLNVNVSHLSTGLYFINVIAPNINFQSKLIKK